MFNIQSNKPSGFSLVNVSFRFFFFHDKDKYQRKTEAKKQCMKTGRFPVK